MYLLVRSLPPNSIVAMDTDLLRNANDAFADMVPGTDDREEAASIDENFLARSRLSVAEAYAQGMGVLDLPFSQVVLHTKQIRNW